MRTKTVKKVALIGLGSIGRRHLRLLKTLRPDLEVILVRSGNGKNWPEENLSKETLYSIEEAIEKGIDTAIIASPATYHVEQAIKLLNSYIPTFIEKPLSNNINKIRELKSLASQIQVPVLVGYVLRHSTDMRCFRKMLSRNSIGKLANVKIECSSYLPDWRPEQDYRLTASACRELGGGVLLELSHELDYANWLFGPFLSVNATLLNSRKLDIDVEDTANLVLTSKSVPHLSIDLSFAQHDSRRQCVVEGSKGRIVWDGINCSVSIEHDSGDIDYWPFSSDRNVMYIEQLEHFLSCVEKGNPPKVSLDEGIAVMNLIDAACRSNQVNLDVGL